MIIKSFENYSRKYVHFFPRYPLPVQTEQQSIVLETQEANKKHDTGVNGPTGALG